MTDAAPPPRIIKPAELAAYYHVDVKTVRRWVATGRLTPHAVTLGGHRRFIHPDDAPKEQA